MARSNMNKVCHSKQSNDAIDKCTEMISILSELKNKLSENLTITCLDECKIHDTWVAIKSMSDYLNLKLRKPEMGRSNIDKVCHSKQAYETEFEAYAVANHILETQRVKLQVYKCLICNKYHLSKTTKHGKGKIK